MFNDDGLGQAMAMDSAQQSGKDAQRQVAELTARVTDLEKRYDQLAANFRALAQYIHPMQAS